VTDRVRPIEVAVEIRMLDEAGQVHRIVAAVELVAVDVDLDQVRGADFRIKQAEGIDQEGARLARHAQRDVVVDRFRPAKLVEHAVAGGQFLPDMPFSVAAIEVAVHGLALLASS
jgi:hypothetical protein